MMDALRSTRAKLAQACSGAAATVAPVLALLSEKVAQLQPLLGAATKGFHYGFIPLILFLGMRLSPRPSLVDLLTPM